jgi:two-component system CheB/CheR fusion protein
MPTSAADDDSAGMPRARPDDAAPGPDAAFPVVAIGASAGGLDAFQRLFDGLGGNTGMAFILVQHLDPAHESLMVDLLAPHTPMPVQQANEGMLIARDNVYVMPPGVALSVMAGALHLAPPRLRRGARMPLDALLVSMASCFGPRAFCVVLSGTGEDGAAGVRAVRAAGGTVIVQDPEEAAFDGMPRSAILTGMVEAVLKVAEIPAALQRLAAQPAAVRGRRGGPLDRSADWLPDVVGLLRDRTGYDFTAYKQGTLRRRIARRMAMTGFGADDAVRYLALLQTDPQEPEVLARDLLINVTSFFRDPKMFETLERQVIPAMLHDQPAGRPLRVWVAGCSTGEEAYSLAMVLREQIEAERRQLKLQIFASDIDPDAIAMAREGLFPLAIAENVSSARLARNFVREPAGYRVLPELRATVVFSIQNVLSDPPFAHVDLLSCRNLLIYLKAEAQTRVMGLFHFALRDGGVLVLGGAESIGAPDGRFTVISKTERLFRHNGRSRPGISGIGQVLPLTRPSAAAVRPPPPPRAASLAELCRRLVIEYYAPAAILINQHSEMLYSLGPTDRYLRVVPGHPTLDVPAMARQESRTRLRAAIADVVRTGQRTTVLGGQRTQDGAMRSFDIDVRPVRSDGQDLLLVAFVDHPATAGTEAGPPVGDSSRMAQLEGALAAVQTDLRDAVRDLEIAGEEHKVVNDEALSANEEYQSTNEELMTSKVELQSLNEELTALNSQLQETLERQRTAANDLQNVLYSTDVATIFLDTEMRIRFFTPATRQLFAVLPSDVGRPLTDLRALAPDDSLFADSTEVMRSMTPREREVMTPQGTWFVRRILPYLTYDNAMQGVVITFVDITERRGISEALGAARREADRSNLAKSRFLAAASHDLRQPMQTLGLLQGLLAKATEGGPAQALVKRLDDTLGAMSGMLNTLLDVNQIEAGAIQPEVETFPVATLLDALRNEFQYPAEAQGLKLRVQPCSLLITSDPRLLGQMLRNLLANAMKFTTKGKVLLGCRRHGDSLAIEIWDTGIGIADGELDAIFEEYHQIDNDAREHNRGLGLGLSIVQRLGQMLGHAVRVRSQLGRGSVFTVDVPMAAPPPARLILAPPLAAAAMRDSILVIEDDPGMRELLELLLEDDGFAVTVAADGVAALALVANGTIRPDLVLADYNLPNGLDGVEVCIRLRQSLGAGLPFIILTGDISTATMQRIAGVEGCLQLNKPVRTPQLLEAIRQLMRTAVAARPAPRIRPAGPATSIVHVVDDDRHIRDGLRELLEPEGYAVEGHATAEQLLEALRPGANACILLDIALPGMSGLELLARLKAGARMVPTIVITGVGDVSKAVQCMKAGAIDFIEKPIGRLPLLSAIARALAQARDSGTQAAFNAAAASRLAGLTDRQREIMVMVLAGHPSKNIAADLNISQRTVENHRAAIMRRTGTKSLPALARLALAAGIAS